MPEQDEAQRSVNIRVNGGVWDDLEDENRSEIARDAFRAAAEMKRDARDILKFAGEYENAREQMKELEATIKIKRQMVYDELRRENYVEFVLPDELPENMTTFEEAVVYSSQYAKTYLENGQEADRVARKIRKDMNEEGRRLPLAVGEWVVEHVEDAMDEDDED